MTSPLAALRDATRSQLWPLPVVSVAAALIIGLAVPAPRRSSRRVPPGLVIRCDLRWRRGRGPDRPRRRLELPDHSHLADVLPHGRNPAARQQPVLAPPAAHLHQRHVRASDARRLPRHLHLLPDSAAHRSQQRCRRPPIRAEALGHPLLPVGDSQRHRPHRLPGPPSPANPRRNDAARRARGRIHDRALHPPPAELIAGHAAAGPADPARGVEGDRARLWVPGPGRPARTLGHLRRPRRGRRPGHAHRQLTRRGQPGRLGLVSVGGRRR